MDDLTLSALNFVSRVLPIPLTLDPYILPSVGEASNNRPTTYKDAHYGGYCLKDAYISSNDAQTPEMSRLNSGQVVLPPLNSIQSKLNKVAESEIIDLSSDSESLIFSLRIPSKLNKHQDSEYGLGAEANNSHSIKVQTYLTFAKTYILNYEGRIQTPNYNQEFGLSTSFALNRMLTPIKEEETKSNKGRKRKHNFECSTMKSLIEDEAVPQWIKYLSKKMRSNADKETGVKPRDDTIWKKIFRDLREFFRILFKQRFHPLDYKSCEQADECCLILLRELGIDASHFTDYQTRKMFYYFHQTRLHSSHHYMSDYVEKEGEVYPMDIIEKYKDSLKAQFMLDPVMSRLFYLLFSNFGPIYQSHLKPKYIGIVDTVIDECIKCYESMREVDDMVKIMKIIFK